MSGGLKFDADKPDMSLLPAEALIEVSRVFTMGKTKYGAWNWAKGIVYTRILAAILRHTMAIMRGEDRDPESGLLHSAHIATNALFLTHFQLLQPHLDDRYKHDKHQK